MIGPRFDPSYDFGTPAIVTFWAAFLGERGAMNKAVMQRRLAAMDPLEKEKAKQRIRDSITELEKAKLSIQQAIVKGDYATANERLRAYSNVIVADTNAGARMNVGKLDAEKDLKIEASKQEAARLKEMTPVQPDSGPALESALLDTDSAIKGGGPTDTGEPVAKLVNGVQGAIRAERVGPNDPKAKSLAYDAYNRAKAQADSLAAAGDSVGAGKWELAAQAVATQFFQNDGTPERWYITARGLTDPVDLQADIDRMNRKYGGGGGLQKLMSVATQMGLFPAPGSVPQASTSTSASRTSAAGGPLQAVAASVGQPDLSGVDSSIADLKAQLSALDAEQAPDMYEGFTGNYLLDNMFIKSDPRYAQLAPALQRLSPKDRASLLDGLRVTGGDLDRAVELLQSPDLEAKGLREEQRWQGPKDWGAPSGMVLDTGGELNGWVATKLTAAAQAHASAETLKKDNPNAAFVMEERAKALLDEVSNVYEGGVLPDFEGYAAVAKGGQWDAVQAAAQKASVAAKEQPFMVGDYLAGRAGEVARLPDSERITEAMKLASGLAYLPPGLGGDAAKGITSTWDRAAKDRSPAGLATGLASVAANQKGETGRVAGVASQEAQDKRTPMGGRESPIAAMEARAKALEAEQAALDLGSSPTTIGPDGKPRETDPEERRRYEASLKDPEVQRRRQQVGVMRGKLAQAIETERGKLAREDGQKPATAQPFAPEKVEKPTGMSEDDWLGSALTDDLGSAPQDYATRSLVDPSYREPTTTADLHSVAAAPSPAQGQEPVEDIKRRRDAKRRAHATVSEAAKKNNSADLKKAADAIAAEVAAMDAELVARGEVAGLGL